MGPTGSEDSRTALRRVSAHRISIAAVGLIVLVCVLGAIAPAPIASLIRLVFEQATATNILVLAALIVVLSAGSLVVSHRLLRGRAQSSAEGLRGRMARRVDGVPWPWSVGLIAAIAGIAWYSLGRALSGPRIFPDEIIYANAARDLVRGAGLSGYGYGLVTPAFDAIAYLLTSNDVDAYGLIQAINVLLMVSAAFPAYMLARRALRHRSALGVAALTVVVPWMVYARFVMTEAAFYLIFLIFVLTLVRALERPSLRRQLVLALALALAFETRTQAVALAGAVASAVLLYGVARGEVKTSIRAFLPTWLIYGSAVAGALALAASGIWHPLGAYAVLLEEGWHPRGVAIGAAANIVSISLGLGLLVAVAAPLGAAALLGRGAKRYEQALAAAAVSSTLWLVLTVAVVSVSPHGLGILHERGLFFVAPLVLICAFAWAARGFPRPLLRTAAIATVMVILALMTPPGVITTHSLDALSFKLWARFPSAGLSVSNLIVAAFVAAVVIVVRLRATWLLVASVALAAVGVAAASDYRSDQPRELTQRYSWVDRTVPAGKSAALLWLGVDEDRCAAGTRPSQLGTLALYTEYFNSRVGPVGHVLEDNVARNLATEAFAVRRDGVVTQSGIPLRPEYVVTDARVGIVGSRVALLRASEVGITDARVGSALAVWRVAPPLRLERPAHALSPAAACEPFPPTLALASAATR